MRKKVSKSLRLLAGNEQQQTAILQRSPNPNYPRLTRTASYKPQRSHTPGLKSTRGLHLVGHVRVPTEGRSPGSSRSGSRSPRVPRPSRHPRPQKPHLPVSAAPRPPTDHPQTRRHARNPPWRCGRPGTTDTAGPAPAAARPPPASVPWGFSDAAVGRSRRLPGALTEPAPSPTIRAAETLRRTRRAVPDPHGTAARGAPRSGSMSAPGSRAGSGATRAGHSPPQEPPRDLHQGGCHTGRSPTRRGPGTQAAAAAERRSSHPGGRERAAPDPRSLQLPEKRHPVPSHGAGLPGPRRALGRAGADSPEAQSPRGQPGAAATSPRLPAGTAARAQPRLPGRSASVTSDSGRRARRDDARFAPPLLPGRTSGPRDVSRRGSRRGLRDGLGLAAAGGGARAAWRDAGEARSRPRARHLSCSRRLGRTGSPACSRGRP